MDRQTRRGLGLAAVVSGAAMFAGGLASPAQAAPDDNIGPDEAHADADASILRIDGAVPALGVDVLDLDLFPSHAALNSSLGAIVDGFDYADDAHAESANLRSDDESIVGQVVTGLTLPDILSSASSNDGVADPGAEAELLGVPAAPLVDAGVSIARVQSQAVSDPYVCVDGEDELARAQTDVVEVDALMVPGPGPLVTITDAAGGSTTTNSRVFADGPGGRLVAEAESRGQNVTLFAGTADEVHLDIVGEYTTFAATDGSSAEVGARFPIVELDQGGGNIITIEHGDLDPVVVPMLGDGGAVPTVVGATGGTLSFRSGVVIDSGVDGNDAWIETAAVAIDVTLPGGIYSGTIHVFPQYAQVEVDDGWQLCTRDTTSSTVSTTSSSIPSSTSTVTIVDAREEVTTTTAQFRPLARTGSNSSLALVAAGLVLLVGGSLALFRERELLNARS